MSGRRRTRKTCAINITTYNVLSDFLCAPSHFAACNPEYLKSDYRYESLLVKLEKQIQQDSVICLQEVSTPWACKLYTFFEDNGYRMIASQYGSKWGGYMGVAVAYPAEKFALIDVDISKIGDTAKLPKKPYTKAPKNPYLAAFYSLVAFFTGLFTSFVDFVLYSLLMQKKEAKVDFWDMATWPHNRLICLHLNDMLTGKEFIVGCYHMPCKFQHPPMMLAQTSLVCRQIQKFARAAAEYEPQRAKKAKSSKLETGKSKAYSDELYITSTIGSTESSSTVGQQEYIPYVLVGDFNIKPISSMYRLITDGKIEKQDPDCAPLVEQEDEMLEKCGDPAYRDSYKRWSPDLMEPLNSAYVTAMGSEPEFTNYAKVRDEPVFVDTLDYIFYSPAGWQGVEHVEVLPSRASMEKQPGAVPLPNKDEPSDHLMLFASIVLA